MAMILISQMCEIGSVTVDECILGKFRYKCSKMKNRQKGIFFWISGKEEFLWSKMKLALCDFNRELLHKRDMKSPEGFNMRRK